MFMKLSQLKIPTKVFKNSISASMIIILNIARIRFNLEKSTTNISIIPVTVALSCQFHSGQPRFPKICGLDYKILKKKEKEVTEKII